MDGMAAMAAGLETGRIRPDPEFEVNPSCSPHYQHPYRRSRCLSNLLRTRVSNKTGLQASIIIWILLGCRVRYILYVLYCTCTTAVQWYILLVTGD